jgi:hypothetical protein
MGRNESRDRDNHRDNQDQVGLEQDLRLLLRIVRIGRRRGSLDIVIDDFNPQVRAILAGWQTYTISHDSRRAEWGVQEMSVFP